MLSVKPSPIGTFILNTYSKMQTVCKQNYDLLLNVNSITLKFDAMKDPWYD